MSENNDSTKLRKCFYILFVTSLFRWSPSHQHYFPARGRLSAWSLLRHGSFQFNERWSWNLAGNTFDFRVIALSSFWKFLFIY